MVEITINRYKKDLKKYSEYHEFVIEAYAANTGAYSYSNIL